MRALVIGAGAAGGIHTRCLQERGVEVFLYDEELARAEALAVDTGQVAVSGVGGDYDFSVVAVRPDQHFNVARQEVWAGRGAIVIEKPLCLRASNAWDLVDLARREQVPLYVAESQAYGGEPSAEQMRELVQKGEFGRPVMWSVAAMTKYRPQSWCGTLAQGGGAFMEGGVHVLTVGRMLFGEPVKWGGAFRSLRGEAPDMGVALVEYRDGDLLSLEIGWGTEGCFEGACDAIPNRAAIIGPELCIPWWPGDNHGAMWDRLLRCIEGAGEPAATVFEAAGAVADVWACYEAAGLEVPK